MSSNGISADLVPARQQLISGELIEVRSITRADLTPLALFLATFEAEARTQGFWLNRFRWWWESNPANPSRVPLGWVLLEHEKIVGFFGLVPTHVQWNGKTIASFSTTTWRVLEAFRNHSMRLFYRVLEFTKGSLLFNTTPSERVVPILKAHRFCSVPCAHKPGKSLIVLNGQRVLGAKIGTKSLAKAASMIVGPLLKTFQYLSLRTSPAPDGTEVRFLARADRSFDELWMITQKLYLTTNVRSAAAINWYCFANGDFRKHLVGYFHGERLSGYLILSCRDMNGLKILRVLDLWLDPQDSRVLAALLRHIHHWGRRGGFDVIEIPHFNQSVAGELASLGLLFRSTGRELSAYYRTPDRHALDPATSYFCELQGDRGL